MSLSEMGDYITMTRASQGTVPGKPPNEVNMAADTEKDMDEEAEDEGDEEDSSPSESEGEGEEPVTMGTTDSDSDKMEESDKENADTTDGEILSPLSLEPCDRLITGMD